MPGALVTAFIESMVTNDVERALTLVSDDIEYDNVPMRAVHGKQEFRTSIESFLGSCSEIEWVVHHQVASGTIAEGVVMNERLDRFLIGEHWLEMPVAGLFVIRDGVITLWRDYFDLKTFETQMAR